MPDLADIGGLDKCDDKQGTINIDISFVMGEMGGKPHMGGPKPEEPMCLDNLAECNDDDMDWKSIAKQLIQAVSMMDTHTDGVEEGTEDADGALKAIDNETSRVLWGKQEEDNPMSSYQNANYGKTTANGLVMTNPAVQCNKDAYGSELDPDTDGDVDFHNPKAVDKIDKAEGFKGAVNNVIQKGSKQRNEKGQEDKKGSFGNSSGSKSESKPGSEEEEPESKESEMR